MNKAIITGITGQDGSHLSELLLQKGYEVHGIIRRSSTDNTSRIKHIINNVNIHLADVTDTGRMFSIIKDVEPTEIYNLSAQSDVYVSFMCPDETVQSIVKGSLNVLDAVKILGLSTKIYQACSSEMFGCSLPPQNELTKFDPVSPYACAKVFLFNLGVCYRKSYGMFVSNGILFNHEGPRRGENFVTQKICQSAARIVKGKQDKLYLGNLNSKRDWGYAPEYCLAMHLMLQHQCPDDFVVATGETHTVLEFLESVFSYLQLDWKKYVEIDESLFRKSEVNVLMGDPSKAKEVLGWKCETSFSDLVKIMSDAAMESV